MQLPRILKSFNVFTDGLNKDGVLMTVKRPDINSKPKTTRRAAAWVNTQSFTASRNSSLS